MNSHNRAPLRGCFFLNSKSSIESSIESSFKCSIKITLLNAIS